MKQRIRRIRIGLTLLFVLCFGLAALGPTYWARAAELEQPNNISAQDSSLRVAAFQSGGQWVVELENSKILLRYGYFFGGDHGESAITSFVVKSVGVDQADEDNVIDAAKGIWPITNAYISYNGTDRKSVVIEWKDSNNEGGSQKIVEATIYPDSTHVRLDYQKWFVNMVDLGLPGGSGGGSYRFVGASSWIRGYVAYPASYYNRWPGDGINDPADGGSLNYNGWFIGGTYNSSSGVGYARVMPVVSTDIMKLLFSKGVENFPYYLRTHSPFSSYLYAVTGGGSEIESVGKALANGGPPPTQPGGTATPTRTRTPTQPGASATPTRTNTPVAPTSTRTRTATPTATDFIPGTGNLKYFFPIIGR